MRLRNTLILALIFAALGAYLYFVESRHIAEEKVEEELLPFEKDQVSRIVLEHPGRKVVLQRVDGKWRLSEPLDAAADERSVENLLTAVHDAKVRRTLDEAESPATYGLDAPSATLQLSVGDNELPSLKVGKKAPIGGAAYVQRGNSESVLLTDQTILAALDKTVSDLRDKTVLSFDNDAVTSIDLRKGEQHVRLAKGENGWRLEAPTAAAADDGNVRSLLTTLRALRANDFASDKPTDLAPYGLDDPSRRVALGLADGTEIDLAVGAEKDGQFYVQSNQRPTVFQVANWLRDSLDKDAAYFRDKTVLEFDSAAARELQLRRGAALLTLRRSDSGSWSSDAGTPRAEAADKLLAALSDLKGYEIAADNPDDLAAWGLEPPALVIRVGGEDGADLGSVELGSRRTDGARTEYTARRGGGDTVFLLRDYTYQQLDKQPKDLLTLPTPSSADTAAPAPDGAAAADSEQPLPAAP